MKKRDKSVTTLADVARRAGVSPTAASFALSNGPHARKVSPQKRKLVREAARALAYVPNQVAQALRRQHTQTVGILFPDFYADWAQRVMQGIDIAMDQHGYIPLITRDSWSPQRQHREILSLIGRQVDGIILVAPMSENLPLLRKVQKSGTPVLFFGETPIERHNFSYVVWNEGQAVELATQHLVGCGRRHIWFVNPGSFANEHLAQSRARISAFEGLCEKLSQSHKLISRVIQLPSGVAAGEQIAGMLANERETCPDAVLASNDLLGLQIMESLLAQGVKIPSQIALMGLCNHPISASPSISLSSVHQPLEQMAVAAGEAMVKLIAGKEKHPLRIVFDATELCIRRSTGQPGSPLTSYKL